MFILIFYLGDDFTIVITDSIFINNQAIRSGGAIFMDDFLPLISSSNIFQANTAKYGPNFASYPIRLALTVFSKNKTIYSSKNTKNSYFILRNEFPGVDFSQELHFELLDHFNQTNILSMNDVFNLEVAGEINKVNKKNQLIPKLLGRISDYSNMGVVSFQNFSLSGMPDIPYFMFITGKSLQFSLNYELNPWEKLIYFNYFFVIPIILNKCAEGSIMDIQDKIVSCKTCETGKFTLSVYGQCYDCKEGGDCRNKGIIVAKPG